MEKIRICFVAIYAYQLFDKNLKISHGGAEVDLYLLAKEFAKDKKYEVIFAVGDFGQKKEQNIDGIKVIAAYPNFKKVYKYVSGLLMQLILFNNLRKIGADIYIQKPADTVTAIVGLYCTLFRKKFIYKTAHIMECGWKFVKETGALGRLYYFGLRRATQVICQNTDQQKMLMDNFGIDAIIIKNGHVIVKNIVSYKKHVLWVARCEIWKRPEIFLEIVRYFPQTDFVMICPMLKHEKSLFQKIKTEAENLPNLKFIEKVPFAEIQKYYNEARIFLGTSDYEGFPNTYLQACLGGTPIVSLSVNPDNFIDEYNLGYCARGDFSVMLEQIKKLLIDNDDWAVKSKNACKYAEENHNIDKIRKQWEEVILETIN